MDAIARLREEGDTFVAGFEKMHAICGYAEYRLNAYHVVALIAERRSLLDALEQARKERDALKLRLEVFCGDDDYHEQATKDAENLICMEFDNGYSGPQAIAVLNKYDFLVVHKDKFAEYAAQRDAAQKDAKDARALLGECKEAIASPAWLGQNATQKYRQALLARIEAMLEQREAARKAGRRDDR
jgi:hypothetical protein